MNIQNIQKTKTQFQKKSNNPIQNLGKELEQIFFPKMIYKYPINRLKDAQPHYHGGNDTIKTIMASSNTP